jgi:flagellar motility protein MotE (MotC chaperone)
MTRILQSPWLAVGLGILTYLGTMIVVLRPERLGSAPRLHGAAGVAGEVGPARLMPSWEFQNPELDELVSELRRERDALRLRQQDLAALAERLTVERQEIGVVTQKVAVLQTDADRALGRVQEQEVANIRRLAKVYTSMSPEGAARVLAEFQDDALVKLLVLMKETEVAPILENMARTGPVAARRVAQLTDRLRLFGPVPPPDKPKTP